MFSSMIDKKNAASFDKGTKKLSQAEALKLVTKVRSTNLRRHNRAIRCC